MSEIDPSASVQSPGILHRIDSLTNHLRGRAAIVVASLALGVGGAATEMVSDVAEAGAQTPQAHTSKLRHPKLVQEYVSVEGSGSHVFLEKCKSGSQQAKRRVTYRHPDQPLGKCNLGSPVTVTDTASGVQKRIARATRKNNHFLFTEQSSQTPISEPTSEGSTGSGGSTGGGGTPEPSDPYESGNVGVDVSWPQCGTANATPTGADFGIVGINAGLTYSANPCLKTEADNFPGNRLNLYVNTAWNSESVHIDPNSPRTCTTGDENCLAYNYGYNAGVTAVNAALDAGVSVNTRIWEDVEPDATWSADTGQNIQSLLGEHDALIDGGATSVGIYSYTSAWNEITGGWQNGWESWGFTSWTTAAEAMNFCMGHEFTGGPSKLMQFTPEGSDLDHNVSC